MEKNHIKCPKCKAKDIYVCLTPLENKKDYIRKYLCMKSGCNKIFKTERVINKYDTKDELSKIKKNIDNITNQLDKKADMLSVNFNNRVKSNSKTLHKGLVSIKEDIETLSEEKNNNLYYRLSVK